MIWPNLKLHSVCLFRKEQPFNQSFRYVKKVIIKNSFLPVFLLTPNLLVRWWEIIPFILVRLTLHNLIRHRGRGKNRNPGRGIMHCVQKNVIIWWPKNISSITYRLDFLNNWILSQRLKGCDHETVFDMAIILTIWGV